MPEPFRAYNVLPSGSLLWDAAHMGTKDDAYDPAGAPGTHTIHVRADGSWWLQYDPEIVDPAVQAACEAGR